MKHLSTNWKNNADDRLMNVLSPYLSDQRFEEYIKFSKSRGCNSFHIIFSNQKDGEASEPGYCIYGRNWDFKIDPLMVAHYKKRIARLKKEKFLLYGWLFTDQSIDYWNGAKKNFSRFMRDMKAAGLLTSISILVCGLELNEYANTKEVSALIKAIRKVWTRKIATHQTSGRYDFAKLAGVDLCLFQCEKGMSEEWIESETAKVIKAVKKPVNVFELSRDPDRNRCKAAIRGGAYGVGNW